MRFKLNSLSRQGLAAVALGVLAAAVAAAAWAAGEGRVSFTKAQAEAGAAVYTSKCAACHGAALQGGGARALSGAAFSSKWSGHTVAMFERMVRTMPFAQPNSLSRDEYLQLVAYILSANGVAAGDRPLAAEGLDVPMPGGSAVVAAANAPAELVVTLPKLTAAAQPASGHAPTQAELLAPSDQDWLMYNRDYAGQRYSALRQITAANAQDLRPVCILQLGETGAFQAGPVIYRGVAYVTTARAVQAFEAATCKRLWTYTYTPKGDEPFPGNRGVALYDGKLFRGTTDGHLLAIDAADGKLLWDVHVADSSLGFFLSAAPVVVDGRVIIGLAGADWGAKGRLYAFDANTGDEAWAFDFIPPAGQPGAETWAKGTERGGGSSWTTVAVDPARHLVFAPVGNPSPDFDPGQRPGANLFTNSVVAVDARTGKLAWHVQQIAGDSHDWDTSAAPVIYRQDGKDYMAVGTKAGWLYLYDRDSRRLLAQAEVSTHENADKVTTTTPLHACPGIMGGVEWNGPAYDPDLKALYVNSVDWCGAFFRQEVGYVKGSLFAEGGIQMDPAEAARGWLRSFDAATGRQLWAYHAPMPMVAGVTPTAGGVVFTGSVDGSFLVFDARSGAVLYRFNTGGAIGGGVMTYAMDGRQYVMATSGNSSRTIVGAGGAATVVVFALP